MTNEQLAICIQQGDSNELIPILWERVRKLMHMLSDRYFRAYREHLSSYGLTADDFRAAAYPAFLKAIEGFDENKGYMFTTYLHYPLKNEFRQLLTKDSLNNAESLNTPIRGIDEGEGIERIDLIADENSLDFTEQAERKSICEAVRAAVRKLPPYERNFIYRRFYKGNTLKEIAQNEGRSFQAVQQYEKKLLQELRRNPVFRKLKEELGYGSYRAYHDTLSGFNNRGISNVEAIASYRADMYAQIKPALGIYEHLPPHIKEKLAAFEESNARILAALPKH